MVKIDPGSHVPIYRQIAQGIGHAIAAGIYRPGEASPRNGRWRSRSK